MTTTFIDVARYQHAARELERFARLRLFDATNDDAIAQARTLLRLTVGVRRKLDKWPDRIPVAPLTNSRSTASTRHAVTSDHPRPTEQQGV